MNQSIKKMYKMTFQKNVVRMEEWFDYIKTKDSVEVHEVVKVMHQVKRRLQSYLDGYHHTTKIRKYANHIQWTDIDPYEVVKIISPKCVEIREMRTKQIVFPKEFHIGGFSAHCQDNFNQKYEYISDKTIPTIRIRKGKNGWKAGSMKFRMSDTPRKHYDYNF